MVSGHKVATELRLAELTEQPWSLTQACLTLGQIYVEKGDFRSAVSVLEQGLGVSRARDVRIHRYGIGGLLGSPTRTAGA